MPQVSQREFEQLPLHVHVFLKDIPLHDVWRVDLHLSRPDITLEEFLRLAKADLFVPSPIVRMLMKLRLAIGRHLGWDDNPPSTGFPTFADRLTEEDRLSSLMPVGMQDGMFQVIYCLKNEQLCELINRTAHVATVKALVATNDCYRFYFAVYVRNMNRFTPFYLALIDPFRKFLVYPSLLRSVQKAWDKNLYAVFPPSKTNS